VFIKKEQPGKKQEKGNGVLVYPSGTKQSEYSEIEFSNKFHDFEP
jgi:hypothetical protein